MMSGINERVIPLDEMDSYEIAEGDPDVRGWRVYASDGIKIGEVNELLVDTEALKVRYLDVELAESGAGEEDRHVLIPVGFARLDETDDYILIDGWDSAKLIGLPPYSQEPLTHDYEASVLAEFRPGAPPPRDLDNPYAGDVYDEEKFYANRRGRVER